MRKTGLLRRGILMGCLSVWAGALFAAPPSVPPGKEEVSGILLLRSNEFHFDGSEGPETTWLVRDNKTQKGTELDISGLDKAQLAQMQRSIGKQVKARGAFRGRRPAFAGQKVFDAEDLVYDQGAVGDSGIITGDISYVESGVEPPPIAEAAPAVSNLTVLTVHANALDVSADPAKIAAMRSMLFSNSQNVASAMLNATWGHYNLVEGPTITVNINMNAIGATNSDVEVAMRNAAAAAGYNRTDYGRVIYCCPNGVLNGSGASWTAYGYISWNETVWSYGWTATYFDGVIHELGHNFGLAHSGINVPNEYSDYTCVMGASFSSTAAPRYTSTYSSTKKIWMGWAGQYPGCYTSVTSDATFEIYPISQSPDSLPGVRSIRLADSDYYVSYVRYLLPYGWLRYTTDGDKVYVHQSNADAGAPYAERQSWRMAGLVPNETYSPGASTNVIFEVYGDRTNGSAFVSIDFPDGNTKPVANAQSASAYINTPKSITLTGSDADLDSLTYFVVIGPTNGVLSGSAPNLTYTPANGYYGNDSFIFRAHDGKISSFATVSITVTAPEVSVSATDSSASETGPDTGTWTISRTGSTSSSLDVFYTLGGTAILTNDYNVNDPSPVTIAAGQSNATVTLTPVDDSTVDEGNETVVLTLSTNASYSVGTSSAVITIADNDFVMPVITNEAATSVNTGSADISGQVTAGGVVNVWICWGGSDGGMTSTGAWEHVVSLGVVNAGSSFSNNITGLATNVTYWYRCYATNPTGGVWSVQARTFSGTALGVGNGEWTPAELLPAAWFDASDAATVLTSGSSVTNWVDKSGNGRNALSLAGRSPVKLAAGMNGLNVIRFTEDRLDFPALSGTAGEWSYVSVLNINDTYYRSGADSVLAHQASVNGSIQLDCRGGVTLTVKDNVGSNLAPAGVYDTTTNGIKLIGSVFASSGVASYTNGAAAFSIGNSVTAARGTGMYLGANRTGDYYLDADHAEWIFFDRALNNTDRKKLEGYLAHKWGQEDRLPSDHAYKVDPPSGGSAIVNTAPSSITSTSAKLNASLDSLATDYDVYVYYGTTDGMTNATSWATSSLLGSFTEVVTNLTYTANVNAGQVYYYTFLASNATEQVWATPSWRFTTPGIASSVATPAGLTAIAVSTSQVNLAWTDNATNETGFLVERSLTSGSGFTGITSRAANVANYSDNAVTPGLTYYYRVTATNATASSMPSGEASAAVPKMNSTVILTNLVQVYNGTARNVGATTAPAGLTVVVTYNGNTYAPTNAGTYAVTGTVNEVSYQGWTNGTLVVSKAAPVVSPWPTATSIEAGQALSNSVLSGGSAGSVDGTFNFENLSATPPLGTNSVNVVFTPADSLNYNTVTGQVDVVVTAAIIQETVTLGATNQVYNGTAREVTVTTSPDAGLAVTVTYDGNAWAPTNVGSYPVMATVTQPGYAGSTNGTLVVTKGTPTGITWPTTTNSILLGQAISNAPLYGGSASVSGTFGYDAPGTTPGVGIYAADVTFTPNDAANYNTFGGSVNVTVDAPELIINNATGAVSIAETVASLSGELVSGGSATAWLCWGLTDRGTGGTGLWDNVVYVGSVSDGVPFTTNVTGLATNTTYFYRCYATNAYGVDWSDVAGMFSGTPAGGVGGAVEWTPADIDPAAWFDASDTATVLVKSGNLVTNWLDKSLNGRNAVAVSGREPVSGSSYINSLNALKFTADQLDFPALSATDGEWSFMGVVKLTEVSPTGADGLLSHSGGATTGSIQVDYRTNALAGFGQTLHNDNGDNLGAQEAVLYQAPYSTGVKLISTVYASTSTKSYFNGSNTTTYTSYPVLSKRDTSMRFGVNRGGANYLDADHAEWIFFDSAISDPDRQRLEGYLAHKWGLTNSLPATHPYKNDPPNGGSLIANTAPINITNNAARLNAGVNAAGTNFDIYVYWGTNNGGTNASSWAVNNSAGTVTGVSTSVSYSASNLVAGQTYYYTFMASNSSGIVWASPSWRFATPGIAQTCQLTVESAYGSSMPVAGTTYPYSNSVVSAWISNTSITNGLTNYVCTGWIGTGSAPASGTGTNMSFTITNNTTITWTWSTNYWVELNVVGE